MKRKLLKRATAMLSTAALLLTYADFSAVDFSVHAVNGDEPILTDFDANGNGEIEEEETDWGYALDSADDLYWFADKVNNDNYNYGDANAVLTKDITVNSDVLINGELNSDTSSFRQWIEYGSQWYQGTFDGAGYTISGLYSNDWDATYVGLFGLNLGRIINVTVTDSYFCGNDYAGGICGYNKGTIENCSNTGTAESCFYAGGICGNNGTNGEIKNCYNTGAVNGNEYAGGICGNNAASITNCYNTGSVDGYEYAGGVCGYSKEGRTLLNCYYLDTTAEKGTGNGIGSTTATEERQFTSGEVCWLLNGEQSDAPLFYQNLGEDYSPVLDSTHKTVYFTSPCVSYSNTGEIKKHLLYSDKKDATCTEDGYLEYWYCIDCGKYFSDEACTEEIDYSDAWVTGDGKIPAEGHKFDENDICTVCKKERYETGNCGDNATYIFDIATGSLTISGTGAVWDEAFLSNTLIKEVVIGNGITEIGYSTFNGCTSLASVTFEENSKLESIDSYAFSDCASLTSLKIPDSVTSFNYFVLYYCTSLTNITAPCTLKDNESIAYAVSVFGTEVTWNHVFADAADTCKCGEISNISGARLILGGILKVEIAFNTEITEADGWTINGKAFSTTNKTYIFEAPAKDFNCNIVIMHGDEKTTFSVSDMIETYKNSDETKVIAEALEEYCKAAEDYFSENGEVADYSEKWESIENSIEPFNTASMGTNYYGSSLLLKSGIILRHYYTSEVDGYTGTKDGCYYIDEIVPAHMYSCTGKYSVNDYIYKALSSDKADTNLKNLCAAIYNYGAAAENYCNGGNN